MWAEHDIITQETQLTELQMKFIINVMLVPVAPTNGNTSDNSSEDNTKTVTQLLPLLQ
jgi:hypothetical protein